MSQWSNGHAVEMTAELSYHNPRQALVWLAEVFDFQTRMIVSDEAGELVFAEAGWDEHTFAIVPAVGPGRSSPNAVSGNCTQTLRIRGVVDVEALCAHARQAGAAIVQAPELFFFGDKVCVIADLEGHQWSFSQRVGTGGKPPEGWQVQMG